MADREKTQGQLNRVQKQLARWRARHGGPGRPIPDELWATVVEVARAEGVEATARALDVNRARLRRRMKDSASSANEAAKASLPAASASFVEVDAERVFSRGQMLVRLTNRDGEQLEITLEGNASDVTAVAQAFWSRAR